MREQDIDNSEVAVSLDEFFEGNEDPGSIGSNLGDDQPPIKEFYRVLKEVAARPDVLDVTVRVIGMDDGQWPYTDTVYIVSSRAREEVVQWVAAVLPTEVHEGWLYGRPQAAPDPQAPYSAYSVWWD
jgi:hypothetical protein